MNRSERQPDGRARTVRDLVTLLLVVDLLCLFMTVRMQSAVEKAVEIHSLSNVKQIAHALQSYASEHEGHLPSMPDAARLRQALRGYVPDSRVFTEPVQAQPYQPNPTLSNARMDAIRAPEVTVVIYDPVSAY